MLTPELNVISVEEETELLNRLLDAENNSTRAIARARISYGNSIYGHKKLDPIPSYLLNLCNKLIDKKILDVLPEDISINIYYPGDKIPPHIDKIDAGPVITILSLLSDAKFILSYGAKKENILLPPRSIIQLKDKYRTHWKHSIEKIKDKRISIVFRQLGKNN
jgi:alkylated DNA repair protein alkB family protein 8